MTINRAKRRGYRLLKRGSRFFKTDLFYLTKNGFWIALGQGFMVLSGLALSIGFANLLPVEVYGNYRFVLALAGVAGAFRLSGMSTAIIRLTAQGLSGTLSAGFKTHLKWSIGITITAFAGAIYYYVNENNTLSLSLLIVGSFSPFLESARLYSAYLVGKKEFRRNTLLGFIRRIVPIVVLLVTISLTNNIVTIVFAYFASNTFTMLSLYWKARKEFIIEIPSKKNLDTLLSDSKHFSLMNLIETLAGHLDKILLFHFVSPTALAVYTFAVIPPIHLRKFADILKPLSLPKLAQRDIVELKTSLRRKTLLVFGIMIPLTSAYIILAPYLYRLLFPQYLDAVLLSQIFSLTLLLVPFFLFGQTLTAHFKKRELYIHRISRSIIKISLSVTLLPLYGIWGALGAVMFTEFYSSLITVYLFYKTSREV